MAGAAMLKTAGGNVGSEWESTDAEKGPLLTGEGNVPIFLIIGWKNVLPGRATLHQQQAGEQTEKLESMESYCGTNTH